MAQASRNPFLQFGGTHRLEEARLFRTPQATRIDGQQNIRWAVGPLTLNPLNQFFGAGLNQVYLSEGLVNGIISVIMP